MNSHPLVPSESLTVTSTSLLDRIRNRDPEAWRRFVTVYGPFVYDACRRLGVPAADTEDIVQEVLISVDRAIGKFKRDRPGDSFRGWLYAITRNEVRDRFRRAAKEPLVVGGSSLRAALEQIPAESLDDSTPGPSSSDLALLRALELIRPEFEERTWTAFWRLTVERHSAAEIAADLGMKTDAVRQAKHRIVKRLRAEFGDLLDLPE
jgi:RNA polymerase sigma-70 factor (ECF subfamily)